MDIQHQKIVLNVILDIMVMVDHQVVSDVKLIVMLLKQVNHHVQHVQQHAVIIQQQNQNVIIKQVIVFRDRKSTRLNSSHVF